MHSSEFKYIGVWFSKTICESNILKKIAQGYTVFHSLVKGNKLEIKMRILPLFADRCLPCMNRKRAHCKKGFKDIASHGSGFLEAKL